MIAFTQFLKNKILPSLVVPNDTKITAGHVVLWLDEVSVGHPENFIKSPYNKDFFSAHGSPTFSWQPLHYVPGRLLSLGAMREKKAHSVSLYTQPQQRIFS